MSNKDRGMQTPTIGEVRNSRISESAQHRECSDWRKIELVGESNSSMVSYLVFWDTVGSLLLAINAKHSTSIHSGL